MGPAGRGRAALVPWTMNRAATVAHIRGPAIRRATGARSALVPVRAPARQDKPRRRHAETAVRKCRCALRRANGARLAPVRPQAAHRERARAALLASKTVGAA